MKAFYLLFVFMVWAAMSFGQIGGQRSFDFLNLPVNAKMSALGGQGITIAESGSQWLINPGLLDSASAGQGSVNFLNYFAGSGMLTASYVPTLPKIGNLAIGLQYLSHGNMEGYDPSGNSLGTFQANETALIIGKSHQLGPFQMGANLKFVASTIDAFTASAILLDIGGTFRPTENENFTVGLALRNFGVRLADYSESSDSALPFDIQIGTSFKPQYMPIRFTITGYNLSRDDVVFFDQQIAGPNEAVPPFSEKIFRRINFGAEVLVSQNFQLLAGYNHLTRKELRLNQTSGGAGFSFGFQMAIKKFAFTYGRAFYHVGGASNYFSLRTNFNEMIKRKS